MQHVREQRTVSLRTTLFSGGSYAGCNFVLPQNQIPFEDPDFLTIDSVSMVASTPNSFRYVLRSNIVENDIFYSFLGVGANTFTLNMLVKPQGPVKNITLVCNAVAPEVGSLLLREEQPSAGFQPMGGTWILVVKITFYKLNK